MAHNGRMHKLLISFLSLALLGACVTPASPEYIKYFSEVYHYSQLCNQAGLMDIDTAGKGMAYASRSVNQRDAGRVNDYVKSFTASLHKADVKTCSVLALKIKEAEVTQAAQAQAQARQPVYQYSAPRTTNCSTYFGQTNCSTF